MGTAALPNTQDWLESELLKLVGEISAIPDCVDYWEQIEAQMFQQTILNPVRAGLMISFASLNDGSAFRYVPQVSKMIFNTDQLSCALAAAEKYIAENEIPQFDAELIRQTVFRLFLLHELHHVSQGVFNYVDVPSLKVIGGDRLIARFDLLADRFAIHALGIIAASKAIDKDEFMGMYRNTCELGLFVNGAIFFQAFDFSMRKPEKNRRALGITFMASRYALFQIGEKWCFPDVANPALDSAIWPLCSPDYTQIGIFTFDPIERLVGVIDVKNPGQLQMLTESLGSVDFAVSVEGACKLLRDVHLISKI